MGSHAPRWAAVTRLADMTMSAAGGALVAAVSLGSCGGGGRTRASAMVGQPLRWHRCSGGQCATLTVPLDYSRPGGKAIKLALFRIPARDPKHRIGSLLFNPGGP